MWQPLTPHQRETERCRLATRVEIEFSLGHNSIHTLSKAVPVEVEVSHFVLLRMRLKRHKSVERVKKREGVGEDPLLCHAKRHAARSQRLYYDCEIQCLSHAAGPFPSRDLSVNR